MIESGLFSLLSTADAISRICGTRIYPLILPLGGKFPAMTYQVISTTPSPTWTTSGMQRLRIEFNCWAESYSDASGLRKALVQMLDGYQGTLSDGTNLQNADMLQATDFFADDARVYRCMIEFYFFFDFRDE